MANHQFKLNAGSEFIPLDKLLKVLNVIGSGGEAHRIIEDGLVTVNDKVELQKRKKMRVGDRAVFNNETIEITA